MALFEIRIAWIGAQYCQKAGHVWRRTVFCDLPLLLEISVLPLGPENFKLQKCDICFVTCHFTAKLMIKFVTVKTVAKIEWKVRFYPSHSLRARHLVEETRKLGYAGCFLKTAFMVFLWQVHAKLNINTVVNHILRHCTQRTGRVWRVFCNKSSKNEFVEVKNRFGFSYRKARIRFFVMYLKPWQYWHSIEHRMFIMKIAVL